MGPGRRHTRSAGIISGTGVHKWTRLVNSLPYFTRTHANNYDIRSCSRPNYGGVCKQVTTSRVWQSRSSCLMEISESSSHGWALFYHQVSISRSQTHLPLWRRKPCSWVSKNEITQDGWGGGRVPLTTSVSSIIHLETSNFEWWGPPVRDTWGCVTSWFTRCGHYHWPHRSGL